MVLAKTTIVATIINLLIGFIFPGIDNFAHIGGLIGGIFITMALGIDNKTTKNTKINGYITLIIYLLFLTYLLIK